MLRISPRYSDDLGLLHLADELTNPYFFDCRIPALLSQAGGLAGRESEVQNTDKEFRVRLDLKHYKPEEVKISSDNKRITIQAKHEEKQDNHGYVSREMTRIYKLPEGVDPKSVTSTMNAHGVLNIKAQKLAIEPPKEIPIPVEFASK